MSSPSGPRRTPTRGSRLSALLLALAGLFAMHGLADHGTTHAADHMVSAATSVSSAAAAPVVSVAMDHGDHVTHAVQMGASTPLSDPGAAVGMCLAVLLLVAVAALVVALSRSRRPCRRLTATPAPEPLARGRAPDPPGLFSLSVQRC